MVTGHVCLSVASEHPTQHAVYCPLKASRLPTPAVHRPPSTIRRPPSITHSPPSTVRRPPSTVRHSSPIARRPPSAVHRPPSTVRRPPSITHSPPSAVRCQPSSTIVHRLPPTVYRPPHFTCLPPCCSWPLPAAIHPTQFMSIKLTRRAAAVKHSLATRVISMRPDSRHLAVTGHSSSGQSGVPWHRFVPCFRPSPRNRGVFATSGPAQL